MAVTTPETFVLAGPGITANAAQIISELAKDGITATGSGPVTITNASIAGAGGLRKFEKLGRTAAAQGATLTYTAAS